LGLFNIKWIISSINRPNLEYILVPGKQSSSDDIIKMIWEQFSQVCGIIFCASRKDCETLALKLCQNGVSACAYHAGLDDNIRVSVQKNWMQNMVRVVCATVAFGMGIDKPDVRFVFHYSMSKSMEAYPRKNIGIKYPNLGYFFYPKSPK
jgi:bloom syndrome protein